MITNNVYSKIIYDSQNIFRSVFNGSTPNIKLEISRHDTPIIAETQINLMKFIKHEKFRDKNCPEYVVVNESDEHNGAVAEDLSTNINYIDPRTIENNYSS